MAAEPACSGSSGTAAAAPFSSKPTSTRSKSTPEAQLLQYSRIRPSNSHSMRGNRNDRYNKELGMLSIKKKIEDAVTRAEMLAPMALELEEAKQIKQEELIRGHDLWDDPSKSNKMLSKLADSTRTVDTLKDLRYKAEEAKLITQLAEVGAINYRLFKQAYNASLDLGKSLDRYEMSKLLRGPYESEGACLIIKAGSGGRCAEIWTERLLGMYTKWGGKEGYQGRIVEKHTSKKGGITYATIEFETEYAYGYLLGEKGVHCMISCFNGSTHLETSSAAVDVIPLFLDTACDLQINDEDLEISSSEKHGQKVAVCVRHIPTGICFDSSGERNQVGNKIKALDRLKAKLLVTAREQGVGDVSSIKKNEVGEVVRRYVNHPNKVVEDVKSGIQLPGLNYVLDGNIDPFIGAHINSRQSTGLL